MALFTDADVVTLDDLLQFENSLVQISSTHNIDVATKINLAVAATGDRLFLWLLQVRGSDPQWLNRRLLGLSTVVVTSTLRRWLCFDSLARFFAEAYNVQLNTRFQAKWTEYQDQASEAAEMTSTSGVGIVYNPLPRPALPLVNVQPGSFIPQALFSQTTWVDKFGNESATSPVNGIILQSPSEVTVAAQPSNLAPPAAAVGWNVYASGTAGNLTRQNNTLLAIGSPWQLPTAGLITGAAPLGGQQPDYYVLLAREIQRG